VHREFLGNVVGQAAWTISNTFALNPGIPASFPWLSNIAQNWETYRFSRLRYCYYTKVGSNIAGSVIISPDYDAADAAPASEIVATTYKGAEEDAAWKNICCVLSSASMYTMGPKKFVRVGALSSNQDLKTYDVGNLFVSVVDFTGAVAAGKLWVEYDVTFFTPQVSPSGNFQFSNVIQSGATLSQASIFGTAGTQVVTGNLGVTAAINTLTLPNLVVGAEYMVSISLAGTAFSVNLTNSVATGLTLKTTAFVGFPVAATSANVTQTFTATAVSGLLTYTVTAGTVTSGITFVQLVPTSAI
jgi:hypothetical protein